MKRILLISLCVCFLWLPVRGARVSVEARMDSVSMLIGCQTWLHLDVSAPENSCVQLPALTTDSVVQGLIVLSRTPIDSVSIGNGRKSIRQDFRLTSFDEGIYYVPPFRVTVDGEEYESNYLTLKILTYDVDTTSVELFDIKGVEKAPFVITDWLLPVGIVLGAALLLWLGIWLYRKYGRRRRQEEPVDPELLLPAHVAALQALDQIRDEKLWQQGRYKDFHTQLTDVLRKYVSRRFDVSAMEMTTAELMAALKGNPEAKEVYASLKEILELADFVKFAKMNPLPDENDRSLRNAYGFVASTTPAEESSTSDADGEEGKESQTGNAAGNGSGIGNGAGNGAGSGAGNGTGNAAQSQTQSTGIKTEK